MNKKTQILVQEILTLAPELKEKEDEIKKLVELLLESKEDVYVDEHFVTELRVQLRDEIQSKYSRGLSKKSNFINIINIFNNKFAYTAIVIVFTFLVAIPFFNFGNVKNQDPMKLAFESTITDVKANGFGNLISIQMDDKSPELEGSNSVATNVQESSRDDVFINESAGSFSEKYSEKEVRTVSAVNVVSSNNEVREGSISMPVYDMQYAKYIFKGDFPNIPKEGNVYRKGLNSLSSSGLAKIIGNLDFGLIDMSTFKDVQVQRLEVVSKEDPAYTISIDFDRGSLSIYRSWDDDEYVQQRDIHINNVSKDKIIQIANGFLKKHNIDTSLYGDPEVNIPEYEYMTYPEMEEKEMRPDFAFAPIQTAQVVYPLVVDGMKVVEPSGYLVGFNISVNLNGNYVESLWGLETISLERSKYTFINDENTILDLIERGGYDGLYWSGEGNNNVDIEVVDPEMVLMKYWRYSENNNTEELLIPALLFKTNKDSVQNRQMYIRDSIVVPLVEGVIQQNNILKPRPYTSGVVDGGVMEVEAVSVDE